MSYHIFLIGEIDQDITGICGVISDEWNHTPVFMTQGTSQISDLLIDFKMDAVFIRIDVASNDGLETTRFLKKRFPEIKLVWIANSERYAMSAFEEGVDALIELPMNHEKIQAALKRLERRRSGFSDEI